ncbi:OmpA family protein, partial [Microvirga brassicacearum]
APQAPAPTATPTPPPAAAPAQPGTPPRPPMPGQAAPQAVPGAPSAPGAMPPGAVRAPDGRMLPPAGTTRGPDGRPLPPADISERRIEDLRERRRQRSEDGGRRVIIEEPGSRTIVREGDRMIIRHDESERFRRTYRDADVRVERLDGNNVTVVRRPDGTEIVTVLDEDGNLVRRARRVGGREVVLIDNRRDRRRDRGFFVEDILRLPPPVVRIPREEYIVEIEDASQEEIYEAFEAPPIERIERAYTLDEVRQSAPLRDYMRRVDLDTITFETGSWDLPEQQIGAMVGIAEAIKRALAANPNEIFLVEGHTDAVGSDEDNLSLSDRRAETVATVLTQRFGIPAENLTTQGYGEQYLKVNTQVAERQNRRATIRRITPLLQGQAQ